MAPDFPNTVFITTSGNTVRPNVAPLRFMLEEATYLEGMLAASMSKTGKAGAVGGMEIPSVKSTIMAFEAGAQGGEPELPGDRPATSATGKTSAPPRRRRWR